MGKDKPKHERVEDSTGYTKKHRDFLFYVILVVIALIIVPPAIARLLPFHHYYWYQYTIRDLGEQYYWLLAFAYIAFPIVYAIYTAVQKGISFGCFFLTLMLFCTMIAALIGMVDLLQTFPRLRHIDSATYNQSNYHLQGIRKTKFFEDGPPSIAISELIVYRCNTNDSNCISKSVSENMFTIDLPYISVRKFLMNDDVLYLCVVKWQDDVAYLMPEPFDIGTLADYPVVDHPECHDR